MVRIELLTDISLSELPLGNRLILLLAGPFQRFFVFSIYFVLALSVLFSFFLLSFCVRACTRSTASHTRMGYVLALSEALE